MAEMLVIAALILWTTLSLIFVLFWDIPFRHPYTTVVFGSAGILGVALIALIIHGST